MTPLLLLVPLAAMAQEEQAEDFRGYIDQAKFYIKKGWWSDAKEQLDLAVNHPDGWADPEAWYLLATVRYELSDIEGARDAASRAHTYSHSEDQLQVSAGFSSFVHEQFGIVEVRAPYPGMAARLDIALQTLLFDPEQTKYLEKIQGKYKRKVVLPQRFGLPVGSYLINGVEVAVRADQPATVELPTSELRTRGPAAAKLAQAEIGVGLSNWLGTDVKNLLPSLDTQIALGQPIGPARVAVLVDWIPTAYNMVNGDNYINMTGWSVGARAGIEIPGTEPLVIRPSIGYRFATVPGLELECTSEGSSYSCGTAGAPTDLVVYAVGRAHIPFFELSLAHLDNRRTSGVGLGVKGVAEYAFGTLPKDGEAFALSDGASLPFYVEPEIKTWNAIGLRALATISVAF